MKILKSKIFIGLCLIFLALPFHNVWGENAKYPFKGEYILKKDWEENEKFFKASILKCSVSYNSEYSEHVEIDYNNILDGITIDKKSLMDFSQLS